MFGTKDIAESFSDAIAVYLQSIYRIICQSEGYKRKYNKENIVHFASIFQKI